MSKTNYMPEGFHTLTPYLIVKDATGALEFYKKVFEAEVMEHMKTPDGKVERGAPEACGRVPRRIVRSAGPDACGG
ncbi:MAG: hypothetical protein HY235_07240 [Acidobacteria bacterium]|nr:hypothetical protein [Acidobacteriota bacterium]